MAKGKEKNTDNVIERPHLIVCEGKDAKNFIIWYLQHLIQSDSRFEKFQAMDGKGVTDLQKFIKDIPALRGFEEVRSITVIRDSETNADGSSQSVKTMFANNRFAVPDAPCAAAVPSAGEHSVKTGYALFPGLNSETQNGTLEDLCLKLLKPERDGELEIAKDAVVRRGQEIGTLKCPHKNMVHTYLSLTDEFVGMKIGESAKANAFDFSAEALAPLKDLLTVMLDESA
jgi:hypothetical protein